MSRYADFACLDRKIYVFLGKAIFRLDRSVNYFHIGKAEDLLNWQRPELNQIIWKMFADYAGLHLCVGVEGSDEYERFAEFGMIGGDGIKDISEEEYLKNWEGLQSLQKDIARANRHANFACLDCKISLSLGKAIFRPDGSVNYFHIGKAEDPLNWQRSELNQIIWKMFADHVSHNLRVMIGEDDNSKELTDFNKIEVSRSEEDYLKNWDGLQANTTSDV